MKKLSLDYERFKVEIDRFQNIFNNNKSLKKIRGLLIDLFNEFLIFDFLDVYDQNEIDNFFVLRKIISDKFDKSDMKKKYPFDKEHMIYQVMFICLNILKCKNTRLTISQLKCLMISAMFHDIDRIDPNQVVERKKDKKWNYIETYEQYKIRHSKKSLTYFFNILKENEIILNTIEKKLIRNLILWHDILPDKSSSNYDPLIETLSLADKLSFYNASFLREYLKTHSFAQAIEKMWTMFLELNNEDRKIVFNLEKGEYKYLFQKMILLLLWKNVNEYLFNEWEFSVYEKIWDKIDSKNKLWTEFLLSINSKNSYKKKWLKINVEQTQDIDNFEWYSILKIINLSQNNIKFSIIILKSLDWESVFCNIFWEIIDYNLNIWEIDELRNMIAQIIQDEANCIWINIQIINFIKFFPKFVVESLDESLNQWILLDRQIAYLKFNKLIDTNLENNRIFDCNSFASPIIYDIKDYEYFNWNNLLSEIKTTNWNDFDFSTYMQFCLILYNFRLLVKSYVLNWKLIIELHSDCEINPEILKLWKNTQLIIQYLTESIRDCMVSNYNFNNLWILWIKFEIFVPQVYEDIFKDEILKL